MIETELIAKEIRKSTNYKIPHSTLDPVITSLNGKYYLAACVFFFNREDIQSGYCDRPTQVVIADIKSGEILKIASTRELEFSDASYEEKYSIQGNFKIPADHYHHTFAILDEVRDELAKTGKINMEKYKFYLEHLVRYIPDGYKRFFYDLSIKTD